MRRLSANYIFPVKSGPLKNGIVEIGDNGRILNIIDTGGELKETRNLEFYNGIIVPGFVNTHCHLELSVLKDVLPEKSGLTGFIEQMIDYRENRISEQSISAIEMADELMYSNGIVAVGDIVNTNLSIETKLQSKIFSHSFIEISGLGKDYKQRFEKAKILNSEFSERKLSSSIVPHAPYSVSKNLFELIKKEALINNSILSLHNQESKEENEMFLKGSSNLLNLFKTAGIDVSFWKKSGQSSIETVLDYLPANNHLLFVHNIYTTPKEIKKVMELFPNSFWVLCPLSNIFIENKLPEIDFFLDYSDKISLGTDSLASNKLLSILAEMKTIHKEYPHIRFNSLLKWATINGAKALKIDDQYGSLENGKQPGLNLITNFDFQEMQVTSQSRIKRLV
ncbi:MAG: amidohydrolase family protein [Thiohalospira sp.]